MSEGAKKARGEEPLTKAITTGSGIPLIDKNQMSYK
jgi:hypothetical protein